jgi:hypothetical protein
LHRWISLSWLTLPSTTTACRITSGCDGLLILSQPCIFVSWLASPKPGCRLGFSEAGVLAACDSAGELSARSPDFGGAWVRLLFPEP